MQEVSGLGKFCPKYINLKRLGGKAQIFTENLLVSGPVLGIIFVPIVQIRSEKEDGWQRQGGVMDKRPLKAHRLLFESTPCHLPAV